MASGGNFVNLKPTEAGNILLSAVQRFFAEGKLVDAHISGKQCESIHCHKLMLCCFSSYFENLLASTEGSAVLSLDSASLEHSRELKPIVDFIYGHSVHRPRSQCKSLLEAAKMFGVTALIKTLQAQLVAGARADTETVVLKPAGISSLLLVNFLRFRLEEKLIDARIGASGGAAFACHKLVLAAFSGYFESLLAATETLAVLSLESVDALYVKQLPTILDYMYGLPLRLQESQIGILKDAARVFGIHSLEHGELAKLERKLHTKKQRKALDAKLQAIRNTADSTGVNSGSVIGNRTGKSGQKTTDMGVIRRHWRNKLTNAPDKVATPQEQKGADESAVSAGLLRGGSEEGQGASLLDNTDIIVGITQERDFPPYFGEDCLQYAVSYPSTSAEAPQTAVFSGLTPLDLHSNTEPETVVNNNEESSGRYLCCDCGRLFRSLRALGSHYENKHKPEQVRNSYDSGSQSVEDSSMEEGIQENEVVFGPMLACGDCDQEFYSRDELVEHMEIHAEHSLTPEKSAETSVAEPKSGLKKNWKPKCRFRCNDCDKSYAAFRSYKDHLSTHMGLQFKCPLCEHQAKSKTALNVHLAAQHHANSKGIIFKKSFKCTQCALVFPFQSLLMRHVNSAHLKLRPFKCPNCAYSATENNALKIHIRSMHTKEKPYSCEECNTKFTNQSHLLRHRRVHHGLGKPNLCETCGERFVDKRALRVHELKAHEKGHAFTCQHCDFRFLRKDHLLVHCRLKHETQNAS